MSTKTLNINTNSFLKRKPMKNIPREPTSPTLSTYSSYSWIVERPSAEIKHIFKSTFNALVEKERDLKLAAEVGKSLLENNSLLEQKYQVLQNEFNSQQQESKNIYQNKLQSNEKFITTLESQNAELLKKYEATLESNKKISRQNNSSQQKLINQVNELYQSLEKAYEKIQDQEDYRQNYLNKMIVKEISIVNAPTINESEEFNELSHKIEQMMGQNQQLFKAKDQIQHQFQDTILELNQLKSQFNQVQQTKEQMNLLENKFQYQENHIHELTGLIEEYKLNLTSDCHSIPSLIESSSHTSSDDDEDYDRFDNLPQHMKGNSLFSELQSAFDNDKNQHHYYPNLDNTMAIAEHPKKRSKRINSKQVLYPNLKIDESLIVPVKSYRRNIHTAIVTHKPAGVVERIAQVPFNGVHFVWRLFRFVIVVQLAMFIRIFIHKN